MSIAIATAAPSVPHTPSMRRRVIAGTTIGNALEFFDFTVFTFLILVIGPLFFPTASSYGQLLLTTATFGVGFLMRPVGGMLIGSYADRHGRRAAMSLTLWMMGLGCGLIVVAPTYAQMGMVGPIMMVLARLIQGFAAGGEVGASTTLLIEHAPRGKRGFYSSWQYGSQALGAMVGATLVTLLTVGLTTEQMQTWGWRVPFVIGILTVPVGAYIRRNLDETLESSPQPLDRSGLVVTPIQAGHRPLRRIFSDYKLTLLKGVLLVTGGMVCIQVINFYIPTFARRELGLSAASALWASVVFSGISFVVAPCVGLLADHFGRKRVIFWSRLVMLIILLPSFRWLVVAPSGERLIVLFAVLSLLVALQTSPAFTMVPELFPKHVRTTGLSVVFGLGISILGGFSQFFVTWLLHVTGNSMAPAWFLMVVMSLSTVVLFWIKDRTHDDIDAQ